MDLDFEQRPWKITGSFGLYEIQDMLNVGGMGTVYAVVDQGGERYALKVIRSELKTDQFLSRFGRERFILSQLDHPNIVKFVDGGETPDGLPYIVMEYVEGQPITRYCSAEKLEVTGRVRLFVQACRAVHYLHERGFVHRDLKPSNIFVAAGAEIKLLDFGVAKSYSDPDKITSMGLTPYTPEFASPEQILGSAPSPQSDVYSLGLILYRLLTGVAPFSDPSTVTRDEYVAALIDHTPAPPSEKSAGSQRLDAITLRALRLRSVERYPNAGALADDLEHCFEG